MPSATAQVAEPRLVHSWVHPSGSYANDLPIGDFDGDGSVEFVVPRALDWLTVSKVASGYAIESLGPRTDPYYDAQLGPVAAADVDGDCRPELLIANNPARALEVWDVRTLERKLTLPFLETDILDVAGGDVDGDNLGEIVALLGTPTGYVLQIYDGATGAPKSSRPIDWPARLELAELDGDAPMEIVVWRLLDSGFSAYDGSSLAEQWNPTITSTDGFAVGDFDGDLLDEIAVLDTGASSLIVFDPGDLADGILWSGEIIAGASGLMLAADLDGDGADELVVRTGWQLRILDGLTGVFLNAVEIGQSDIRALAAGDVDGDGAVEIVWRGDSSDGCDAPVLGVLEGDTLQAEWRTRGGQARGLATVAASPAPSLFTMIACQSGGNVFPVASRLDGRTWRETDRFEFPELDVTPQPFFWYLASAGSGGPAGADFFLAADTYQHPGTPRGRLLAFDSSTAARPWSQPLDFHPRGLAVAELVPEAGDVLLILDTINGAVQAFASIDGAPLWTTEESPGLIEHFSELAIGQIDADPELELAALGQSNIGIFSGGDGTAERWIPAGGVESIAFADANGDGLPEIVEVGVNRLFRIVDPRTGAIGPQIDLFDPFVWLEKVATAAGLRNAASQDVVVISGDGRAHLVDLSGPTVVWSSEPLLGHFYWDVDAIALRDVDGDGDLDLLILSDDRIDHIAFPRGLIFADDFEDGATLRWARLATGPGCP